MQLIYKNKLKFSANFVTDPDTGARSNKTKQYAPAAKPITVVHAGTEPAAQRTANCQTDINHKLHVTNCST